MDIAETARKVPVTAAVATIATGPAVASFRPLKALSITPRLRVAAVEAALATTRSQESEGLITKEEEGEEEEG